jgi:hypothetical protein
MKRVARFLIGWTVFLKKIQAKAHVRIDLAVRRKALFEADPAGFMHAEE